MSSSSPNKQSSVLPLEPLPQPASTATPERHSYTQILKSSALVGGSSLVNIAIGIVRTKAMAILLGPAGFGLFGLYGFIANLTQSIFDMGINSSGPEGKGTLISRMQPRIWQTNPVELYSTQT